MSCFDCAEALKLLRSSAGSNVANDHPVIVRAASSCIMPADKEWAIWTKANQERWALQARIDDAKAKGQAHLIAHGIGVAALATVPVIGPALALLGAAIGQISIDQANEQLRRMEAYAQLAMLRARVEWCCGATGPVTAASYAASVRLGTVSGQPECSGQPMAVANLPGLRALVAEARAELATVRGQTVGRAGYLVTPDARVRAGKFVGPF